MLTRVVLLVSALVLVLGVIGAGAQGPGYPFVSKNKLPSLTEVEKHRTGAGKTGGGASSDVSVLDKPLGTVPELPLPEVAGGGGEKEKAKKRRRVEYRFGVDKSIPVTGRSLPPLGKLGEGVKGVDPTVIYVTDGVVYETVVSRYMPNRIVTPFRKARVVDSSGAQIQTVGGDVYILPASGEPFVVYIMESGGVAGVRTPTVGLLLRPVEDLPAQVVMVSFERPSPVDGGCDLRPGEDPYIAGITSVFRSVVRGQLPDGFTKVRIKSGTYGVMGKVVKLEPVEYYTGVDRALVVYRATNMGTEAVELTEESFYRRGVRAVAIFPDLVLMPSASTRVFVLMDSVAADDDQR